MACRRLIARGADRRFQFGYWHIEPLLAFLNGALLLLACIYGVTDAAGALLSCGRPASLASGSIYAAISTAISLAIFALVRSRGRKLGSTLLDLDAHSWLAGSILSAGLCVSLGAAGLFDRLGLEPLTPYADPAILLIISMGMAPLPISTMIKAGREILHIAPPALDATVREIAADIAARHGFIEAHSYVTRSGRAQFVEIVFVGPAKDTAITLGQIDQIREDVATAMGGLHPGYWLTVDVTADPRWI